MKPPAATVAPLFAVLLMASQALVAQTATLSPSASSSPQAPPACVVSPPAVLKLTQANIFSDQQEQWLGDAMADMLESTYRPVRDPAENAYLKGIADRLLLALPPTQIPFRLELVDSPEINGLSLAGGRVYLTRKLVANARTEDEVAGVIAHEMGHILSHQFAVQTTVDLKRLMGVTSVSDRADVYAKFQRLMDLRARDKSATNPDSDEKQDQADRIAVYAMAAAGYRPQALAEFWNRSFFVGGKTGNRFLDLVGVTSPTQKRFRLMEAMTASLPPACNDAVHPASAEFTAWQAKVIANQSGGTAATVAADSEIQLEPHLRMEMERLRFSPDGKYILAQDDSSVFVMTRQPFAQLFRLDAESAGDADFTPDSSGVVFSTAGLHTELWSVADRKLIAAHEVVFPRPCVDSFLSPDGRTVVCVSWNDIGRSLNLDLLDVATSSVLFEQKRWFEPTPLAALVLTLQARAGIRSRFIPRALSSDGATLVIGPGSSKLAFDLRTRAPIKLGGEFRSDIDTVYAFQGPNTVFGLNGENPAKTGIFSFPDGKSLRRVNLRVNNVDSVTRGGFLLVRDLKDYAITLTDLEKSRFVAGSKHPAMDAWDSSVVGETNAGALQLSTLTSDVLTSVGMLDLSQSPLGNPQSAAFSPDGRYLAFSARGRGALWNLATGKEALLLHSFRGGGWTDKGTFYAAFAEQGAKTSHVLAIDLPSSPPRRMSYTLAETDRLLGGHVFEAKQKGNDSELIAHAPEDNAVVWTRSFRAGETSWTRNAVDGNLIFASRVGTDTTKEVLRGSPVLAAEAAAIQNKDAIWLVQIVSAANGVTLRQAMVETPAAFNDVDGFHLAGDQLYLSARDNRTTVYSMPTGNQVRQIFGRVIAGDDASGRICVENRRGELTVYAPDGVELGNFRLGSTVRLAALLKGGTELQVLTADQKVRRFTLPAVTPSKATNKS